MKTFHIMIIFLVAALSPFRACPAAALCQTPDEAFSFAQSLANGSDYDSAVTEFKRFAFFFPDDPMVPEALFSAGMARFRQHRYSDAMALFTSVREKYGASDSALESAFMISRCLAAARETDSAIDVLARLCLPPTGQSVRDRALARTGWLCLEKSDFMAAKNAFSKISDKGRQTYHVREILLDIEDTDAEIPRKSPFLAGLFSMIPGGGYLYCGRYRDAGMAFFLNSVLAAAAYESFDKRLYALGGMLGSVGIGFYGGSIYGGITSAHKYNARSKARFLNGLKQRHAPAGVSLVPARRGFRIAFCLKF